MEHPITPPPDLVQRWINEEGGLTAGHIATQAAQWGADQELEACCEWTTVWISAPEASQLRAARRPKPPIKADQALAVLNTAPKAGTPTVILDIDQFDTILLALGRMKEMEGPAND